jgi:filamentous hemagglutinin
MIFPFLPLIAQQRRLHRPAPHFACIRGDHHGQIQPALPCPYVGNIRHPDLIRIFNHQAFSESGLGTGGKVQQAIQAATAAVQGLAGGDISKALAGASAPYIANVIGHSGLDDAGKVLAHAAVNAALAAAQGNNALVGAGGAATAEMVGMIAVNAYGKPVSELSETEKQTVSALATLAAGLAGGLAGGSTADAAAGAQAGKTTVENNYLSSKQIDAWSAEMKQCQAGGGDCGGIVTKYEELSTAQQKQLISDCVTSPVTCQQKYGDVLTDSMAVKQALDRAMGEDIPIKMVYDLTATWAHQMDADGIVASNKVSEQIMAKYGLDQSQADIIAGVALSALGGVSKAGKPNYTLNKHGAMLGINGPTVPSKTL